MNLVSSFTNFRCFLLDSLGLFCTCVHVTYEKGEFYSLSLLDALLHLLRLLVLTRNGERGHPNTVPNLREKSFFLSPLSVILAGFSAVVVCFFYLLMMVFIWLKKYPFYS